MKRSLRQGTRGPDIQHLQELLNHTLHPSPPLQVDGDFGPLTEAAVRAYQATVGIGVDGIVGPSTWRAFERGLYTEPSVESQTPGTAEKLKAACADAFSRYPHSCSHAVWHVIKQYAPAQPYMTANALIHYMRARPKEWQEVKLYELSLLATQGALIVGGAEDVPNGHVIIVHPGKEKFSGGYFFKDKVSGREIKAPPKGMYALAMSTSMGSWPGARSRGDKTVFDPWGSSKFQKVKFWRYIGH